MTANNKKVNDKTVILKSNIKKEKRYIAFLLLAVVMFVVILISTVFRDVLQIINNEKETQQLIERKTELLEEEASLNSEVIKLQDPAYIARYAREKYLYTKDGEKILTIIDIEKTKTNKDNKDESNNNNIVIKEDKKNEE